MSKEFQTEDGTVSDDTATRQYQGEGGEVINEQFLARTTQFIDPLVFGGAM